MGYHLRQPSPPLRGIVDYVWALRVDIPRHARERIVPTGTLELVIDLQDDARNGGTTDSGGRRLPGAMVSGCYGAPFAIETRAHAFVMGVHFRPGGAAGLFDAPPGELANMHVGLGELWGARAGELHERMRAAPSLRQRYDVLEQALIARLRMAPAQRDMVQAALTRLERPVVSVGEISESLGLSRRRFIEVFTADVGMTPKRYARVRRFQRALTLATQRPSLRWSELALTSGYYDQAHLCRDWADFTGFTPAEVVSRSQVKHHHLAAPAPGSNPSNTARAADAYGARKRDVFAG